MFMIIVIVIFDNDDDYNNYVMEYDKINPLSLEGGCCNPPPPFALSDFPSYHFCVIAKIA